jgi:hypothetical protein
MLKMIGNLTKAAIAVAVTPVTIVADVVMMPHDAFEDEKFANRTAKKIKQAGAAFDAALTPDRG